MKFTLNEIEDFQKIWFENYGEILTEDETIEYAGQFFGLLQAFIGLDEVSKLLF